jgi:hypothetical protein
MKRKKIIVLGFMGGMPIAGVIWQHIHYIVGLQRLGHEVWYVEDRLNYPYDPVAFNISEDHSYAARTLARLASEHGFEGRWAFCARYKETPECSGISVEQLRTLYREADCALNVCGSHDLHDDLRTIRNLIYVESDPGVEQIKIDLGDEGTMSYLREHHHLFTFGENIGTPSFVVPTHGFHWLTTRQPVVTDLWCPEPEAPPPDPVAHFTTICNWSTSGKKDIAWRGSNYLWSKSLEFLRFVEAPALSGEIFEMATDIKEGRERSLFEANGWKLVLPHDLSVDWNGYRDYIAGSRGEFTCAKDQYVRLNTGWFSDRTACYLAAGRPVITQETGFGVHRAIAQAGGGLITFSDMKEIVEAVAAVRSDYARHSRAALAIAREVFEAEKVLKSLLDRAGV